ncbi:MAG: nucleotidyl transferase AbiEii/AbiGii toxin family protein [Kiritimatiellia bacterium]|nr:nucleotidyl transferase AbiEii/AbiGii toxin family protein [Kiritimatiellia bacterium]MDP6810444.1 nucleotidyl transferase AbiEii/AbiGii toxin family protein [Kiritimatiellia bacterium]
MPEWSAHLTFKGGTSLSKAWGLIERFSEDIDIVISRAFLGFSGDHSPENMPSKKKRRRCLEELKAACQTRIRESLEPALRERVSTGMPADVEWTLEPDQSDPDDQTLLLAYSTVIDGGSPYVRPVVKIELGARSDTEPTESPTLQPYVADAFPDLLSAARFSVRAVAPRRTFWEKSMLLHEESFRPPEKTRRARLARHYYDLWCLIKKGVSEDALADMGLFARIASHREVYFRWSWVDYSTLCPGSLRLVPESKQIEDWRRDYDSMKETMFFGEAPPFDEIIRVVGDFEHRFNEQTPS